MTEKTYHKAVMVTILVIIGGVLGGGFQEAAHGTTKDKKREILKCLVQADRYVAGWRGLEWRIIEHWGTNCAACSIV